MQDDEPLSAILIEICRPSSTCVTVEEIMSRFGSRAFGAALFVFSLPNLLPLPPGSSTVLGAPMALLAPQVAIGVRCPWLPRRVAQRPLRRADLRRVFQRLIPGIQKIERLSRPRLEFLFGPVGVRLIGALCTMLALVLVLPIPLGNLLPAAAVATLSLALFQRDGLLALVGYGLAGCSVAVLSLGGALVMASLKNLISLSP